MPSALLDSRTSCTSSCRTSETLPPCTASASARATAARDGYRSRPCRPCSSAGIRTGHALLAVHRRAASRAHPPMAIARRRPDWRRASARRLATARGDRPSARRSAPRWADTNDRGRVVRRGHAARVELARWLEFSERARRRPLHAEAVVVVGRDAHASRRLALLRGVKIRPTCTDRRRQLHDAHARRGDVARHATLQIDRGDRARPGSSDAGRRERDGGSARRHVRQLTPCCRHAKS